MSNKVMVLGTQEFDIIEDGSILPIHADVYTEVRVIGTQVRLSLASLVVDSANKGELRIVARLSLPLEMISNIGAAIQDQLTKIEEAKKAAN